MEKHYIVTSYVTVNVDETKFTPKLMDEFKETIDETIETIEEHMERLALLHVQHGELDSFIEGIGDIKEMNIRTYTEEMLVEEE